MAETTESDLFKSAFLEAAGNVVFEQEIMLRRVLSRAHRILEEKGIDLTKEENVTLFVETAIQLHPQIIPIFREANQLRKAQNKGFLKD